MIDKSKQYRTRDGREVRIYAVDGGGEYSVHGAFLDGGVWNCRSWSAEGCAYSQKNGYDLIEVKPRIKRKVWVNVYPEDSGMPDAMYLARANAEHCAFSDRIACVEIDIDVEEGHGL